MIYAMYGRVFYLPMPWDIAFEHSAVRCVRTHFPRLNEIKNPTDENPAFWREVRQSYFAFERGDQSTIREFYRQYGPFGSLTRDADKEEKIADTLYRLDWFRELTCRVEQIKARKAGPLWEWFDNAEKPGDGRWYLFQRGMGFIEGRPYITFIPWFRLRREGGQIKTERVGPSNEDELFLAAWQAVVQAVQDGMQQVLTVPHSEEGHTSVPAPVATFVFHAPGAFAAAFLQWFFQEMATVNVIACEAENCTNPVFPPRKTFCSERCRQREKKRRQRAQEGENRHGEAQETQSRSQCRVSPSAQRRPLGRGAIGRVR